jgi:hypothetical protein
MVMLWCSLLHSITALSCWCLEMFWQGTCCVSCWQVKQQQVDPVCCHVLHGFLRCVQLCQ